MTLSVSLLAATAPARADGVSQKIYAKSDLLLVTTVINATSPYMASYIQGSKNLAAKLGVPLEIVQSNGSSQTEVAGIQAQAAKDKTIVLVTDPMAASNVPAVVNKVRANGGHMGGRVEHAARRRAANGWRHARGLRHRRRHHGGQVRHRTADRGIGGHDGLIAHPGVLDSTVSEQRYAGLLDTLKQYSEVNLLDSRPDSWDQSIALRTMQQWSGSTATRSAAC